MNDDLHEEFFDAFKRLSDDEKLLIERFAYRYHQGTTFSSPLDLIHEVIGKIIDGERHWPRHVNLAVFIASTVRSVASNSRKKSDQFNITLEDLEEEEAEGEALRYEPTMSAERVALLNERGAIAAKAVDFAKATLQSDTEGLQVLQGMVSGLEPTEMCSMFGLNAAAFKAARQRVVTRLKLFGQRNPL
jgi:DNA-directed RNA polymerase specialized sigma24 family protein